jgi:hypothetical protein
MANMIYKTLHRKLKIKQNEPHKKLGVNSGADSKWVPTGLFCLFDDV